MSAQSAIALNNKVRLYNTAKTSTIFSKKSNNSTYALPTITIAQTLSFLPNSDLLLVNKECMHFAYFRAATTIQRAIRAWRQSADSIRTPRAYLKRFLYIPLREDAAEIIANNVAMRKYDQAVNYFNSVNAADSFPIRVSDTTTLLVNNAASYIYSQCSVMFDNMIADFVIMHTVDDDMPIFYNSVWLRIQEVAIARGALNTICANSGTQTKAVVAMIMRMVMERFQEHLLDAIYEIPFCLAFTSLVDMADDDDIDTIFEHFS